MEEKDLSFHWADYVVFGLSLAISLAIGIFFAFYGKGQGTTKDYLLGGNNMNPLSVGLSIFASVMNGVFLIGVPSEVYYFGTIYLLLGVAFVISAVVGAHVFIPFFRARQHVSCYEYLQERFDSVAVRMTASAVFAASMMLFLGIVLYAPALAFEAVTGLEIHYTLIACGVVCTAYVALGGLKAVVWTDTVQMVIMIVGTLAIAIMGIQEVGGGIEVWKIAKEDNRVNYDITSGDATVRHSIWTQCIGHVFLWLPLLGSNQMIIQRYYAVKSTLHAQISLYVGLAAVLVMIMLVGLCGLVMYAFFRNCDPRISGRVEKGDQLFPLLLMELMGEYHGLPGLYVAAVFAAALSSISSAVNSLAAVILEDFVKPFHAIRTKNKPLSDLTATRISKALSLFFGLLTIALSYAVPHFGDELIQLPTTIWGVVGAPLFGLFILAIFFPCANSSGALCGLLVSLIFSLWLSVGGILYGRGPTPIMPLGLCTKPPGADGPNDPMPDMNVTDMMTYEQTTAVHGLTTLAPQPRGPTTEKPHELEDFYSVSYAWYGLINTSMCIVVGLFVSGIVDGIYGYGVKERGVKGKQVYDCGRRCPCVPHRFLHWVRCNVEHDEDEQRDFADRYVSEDFGLDEMPNGKEMGADNPTFQHDHQNHEKAYI